MTQPITIPRELPQESTLNYEFLRAEGIRHIQRLAGHIWTDHNAHDPGITILEQLCYAITDLAYRADNDIKDLLGRNDAGTYRDLYGPASILTVNPVTMLDIRKVVIDVPGVKNAWVEKVSQTRASSADESAAPLKLKGLYRVVFEKAESNEVNFGLLDSVKARLHERRGICEDFEEIRQLDPQFIRLHGTIEVGQVDDIHQFVAHVLLRAATYISPRVPFHTMRALLDKGKKTDEIFDGPALFHGFIDNEELIRAGRKQEIHTSALIREIMDQDGVLAVNELALSTGSETMKSWVLPLDMAKAPKLDARATLDSLTFAKHGLKASIDKDRAYALYLDLRDEQQFEILAPEQRDIVLPETGDRRLESYYSIQNQFPANYGIGELGLSDSAPAQRKAQAKQLRAYLLFFEQLLANYFSQVAHFKDLLGFDGEDRRTYFNQSLLDSIPGLEEVVASREAYENYLQEMTADTTAGLERKNAFLNHLLARFSEAFTDYGMLLHDPEQSVEHFAAQKLITDKSNFLRDYPALSGGRGRAFDYLSEFWGNDNISGLEKRIARKLGVEDYTRRNLGEGDSEGFHLVEHILLRQGVTPKAISAFEATDRTDRTRCISPAHRLQNGEEIRILGSESYNGEYLVEQVSADSFEIGAPFVEPAENLGNTEESSPRWERSLIPLRDLVLTDRIGAFSASPNSGHTRCEVAGHGLLEGETIEIVGTEHYNGVYAVSGLTADSFEIARAFEGDESAGRWKLSKETGDPYSLQLTFVFPDWSERYKNGNFKTFVNNMLREETPAHLTVYVQWLNKPEMQRFDRSYRHFLSTLQQR